MRLVDHGEKTGITSYVTELIGTFFLVLTIELMAATQSSLAPARWGYRPRSSRRAAARGRARPRLQTPREPSGNQHDTMAPQAF